ncbi:hypothetical protein HHI36_021983 [Cryptolaemus montrouzieri]|uniref:RRM domain-containing protein n=1 Tax=Cryptolaemus montrouzieri TaxID=559131 RepID=A0ABD2MYP3_9CUCU
MGNEKLKLYVRFPRKIEEELEVKNLCPDIVSVHLPRQKSARWCIVDFKTKENLEEGVKILKKCKIEGKPIIVKPVNNKEKSLSVHKSTDSVKSVEHFLQS